MEDHVLEVLKQAIVDILNVHEGEILPETTFMEDLGADSLDIYQIVTLVEERLEIDMSEADLSGIKTVGEALELLKNWKQDS